MSIYHLIEKVKTAVVCPMTGLSRYLTPLQAGQLSRALATILREPALTRNGIPVFQSKALHHQKYPHYALAEPE
jgi:hypothetical protein